MIERYRGVPLGLLVTCPTLFSELTAVAVIHRVTSRTGGRDGRGGVRFVAGRAVQARMTVVQRKRRVGMIEQRVGP